MHPYLQLGRVYHAMALELSGRIKDALAQYRLARVMCPDLPWLRVLEGAGLARAGRTGEAHKVLLEIERLRAAEYVDAYSMALLHEAMGDREGALQELARAFEEGSTVLPILDVDPRMDRLRPRLALTRLSGQTLLPLAAVAG